MNRKTRLVKPEREDMQGKHLIIKTVHSSTKVLEHKDGASTEEAIKQLKRITITKEIAGSSNISIPL